MTAADFRDLQDFQKVRLNKELKGSAYQGEYTAVVRVTKESAKKLFFGMEDGSRCSVADYFQNRYGHLVQAEPALHSGSAASHTPSTCPWRCAKLLKSQHCRIKLGKNQTSEMIKRTAQAPAKRFNEIRQSVRDLLGSGDKCLHDFNIKISTEPTQLKRAGARTTVPAGLDNFVKLLLRTGHELGMRIEQPGCISSADTKCKPIHTALLEEWS
ncbi:hypothetical protein MRX96_006927 [Rhipicephalus microplus]